MKTIKIKKQEEIEKRLDKDNHDEGLYFNSNDMGPMCGKEFVFESRTLISGKERYLTPSHQLDTGKCSAWLWKPEWLELGTEEEETEMLMEYFK